MKKILTISISFMLILTLGFAQNAPTAVKSKVAENQQEITVPNSNESVNPPSSPIRTTFYEDVESHPDFAINSTVNGWSYIDGDDAPTWGIENMTFPGSGQRMAYIVFNPTATTPPGNASFDAFSPDKYFACFSVVNGTPPNNDWLISPELEEPTALTFWARSYTSLYGLERMKVGYSTSGKTQEDFTMLTEGLYVQVLDEWSYYEFNLPEGTKYIAIVCVSDDAFFFMIDDIEITFGGTSECNPISNLTATYTNECAATLVWTPPASATAFNIYRDGAKIASNHTQSTYTDSEFDTKVGHTWGVTVACTGNESKIVEKNLDKCEIGINEFEQIELSIVPNPAVNEITIYSGVVFHTVEVINFLGQTVISYHHVGNTDKVDISNLTNGVYFVRVLSENGTAVKKFIKQ